jgi:hypothetical protein
MVDEFAVCILARTPRDVIALRGETLLTVKQPDALHEPGGFAKLT